MKYLTIWDLPPDVNKREIEYMCRSLEKMQIVKIKRTQYKALAVVETTTRSYENNPWSLPIDNNNLVRVTQGDEDYEKRNKQKQFVAKLLEIPRGASETLLLRSLRSKGAKSVFIPRNRNGNPKGFALVSFANAKELANAQSRPMRYNNYTVFWEGFKAKKDEERRTRPIVEDYTGGEMSNNNQEMDYEYNSNGEEVEQKSRQKEKGKKRQDFNNEKSLEDWMWSILERLDKIEMQQGEKTAEARLGLADCS